MIIHKPLNNIDLLEQKIHKLDHLLADIERRKYLRRNQSNIVQRELSNQYVIKNDLRRSYQEELDHLKKVKAE